ncbi:MAG: zf-HC2 domain-containing protein [Candidatus Acidiferrales bacterium]
MNCERVEALLPDYLHGSLAHDAADKLEQHLEQCAQCKETVTLWNRLADLPQEQPSPLLRARFEAMLNTYQAARSEKLTAGPQRKWSLLPFLVSGNWARAAAGFAAAAMLLVAGFAAGRFTMRPEPASASAETEIASVREELRDMRQLVVLSMLQQQSASERLQAVAMGTQQAQINPEVMQALLRTLRFDSSVDVRLAALNALSRHSSQPGVRAGLVDALQANQSPLVQVTLIDRLVQMREASAVEHLQQVRQDPALNPAVRQRAEWALGELQ